jgi:hypothetical protein
VQHYERIGPDYKYLRERWKKRLGTHPNPNPECGFSPHHAGNAQTAKPVQNATKGTQAALGILLNSLLVNKLPWFFKVLV